MSKSTKILLVGICVGVLVTLAVGCQPLKPSYSTLQQKPGNIVCFTPQGTVLFSGQVEHAAKDGRGNFWRVFVTKDRFIRTNATCFHEVNMDLSQLKEDSGS